MGSYLATLPITTVKENVAGTSLASDFKLLTCSEEEKKEEGGCVFSEK